MNRLIAAIGVAGLSMTIGGCAPPQSQRDGKSLSGPQASSLNAWSITSYYDQQSEAGVVRQRTIFQHHFVDGTPLLNDLGRSQVRVLARHFKHHPGSISIRHDGNDPALLEARVESVRAEMIEAGVAVDLVSNGPTGGDGAWSDHVLVVLTEEQPVWQPHNK